jgi:hypothetical protein
MRVRNGELRFFYNCFLQIRCEIQSQMASSNFLQFFINPFAEEERESDDGSLDKKRKRPRKQREELEREDFQNAPWQRMIDSGSYNNPRSRHGLHFRRRYRVPAPLFDYIVEKAVHGRWFPEYGKGCSAIDALGRPIPSLHVKILSSLRILGTGCAFSDCYDGSFMDGQTVRKFYYRLRPTFKSDCASPRQTATPGIFHVHIVPYQHARFTRTCRSL